MKTGANLTKLTWLGHAAFLLETKAGVKILLDPYRSPDAGNYAPIQVEADIVLVSHLNPKYHSHWEAALGNPIRLNGLDFAADPNGATVLGIQFRVIQVWESEERMVPVSMLYFTVDGTSFCHSGDLGHALTEAEAAPILEVDVLLAVAGGPPTISLLDLKTTIDLIRPRLVIPMHYQNGKVNLPIQPVDDFLSLFPADQIERHSSSTLEIGLEMPAETRIVVLPSAL